MIEQLLFYVFSVMACGGAIAVVMTQNVVRMAFWLVVSLGSVAALFFLLHADFLGAAQLLIYVGGTVVLLVFGVMLTASGAYTKIQTSPAEVILGSAVGGILLFVLVTSISGVKWADQPARFPASATVPAMADDVQLRDAETGAPVTKTKLSPAELQARQQQGRTVRQLGLGFLGLRPDRNLNGDGSLGLAPGYLLPFEIISIHLLVVLIGAAYLARAKRRLVPRQLSDLG